MDLNESHSQWIYPGLQIDPIDLIRGKLRPIGQHHNLRIPLSFLQVLNIPIPEHILIKRIESRLGRMDQYRTSKTI